MAVADLHKTEFAFRGHNLAADDLVDAIRLQHAAADGEEHPRARPRHAFQETAAVDAVVVVIVNDFVSHWFVHSEFHGSLHLSLHKTTHCSGYSRTKITGTKAPPVVPIQKGETGSDCKHDLRNSACYVGESAAL